MFEDALKLYREGDWKAAQYRFSRCKLPMAEVFNYRTKNFECPKKWNGIWTMETK